MLIRKIMVLVMTALLYLLMPVSVLASVDDTILFSKEIKLPDDMNFTTKDTCSGHAYFMQATANEKGEFAVYSLHIEQNNINNTDFSKVYIDLYDSDGNFYRELSFNTSQDKAIELTSEAVYVYFFDFVLVYEISSQELHCYATPAGEAANNGLYTRLRRKNFSCGEWEYSCKKGIGGYTKLIRRDGNNTQILVDMPGTMSYLWYSVPAIIIAVAWCLFAYKQKNRGKDRGRFSVLKDDSPSSDF